MLPPSGDFQTVGPGSARLEGIVAAEARALRRAREVRGVYMVGKVDLETVDTV